jgi:hypothetical protein
MGMQQNELVELLKSQHALLEKHLGVKAAATAPKFTPRSSNNAPALNSNSSKFKPANQTQRRGGPPKPQSNGWKGRKPQGKPFKPRTTVNQVEEDGELEEEYQEDPNQEYEEEYGEEDQAEYITADGQEQAE